MSENLTEVDGVEFGEEFKSVVRAGNGTLAGAVGSPGAKLALGITVAAIDGLLDYMKEHGVTFARRVGDAAE